MQTFYRVISWTGGNQFATGETRYVSYDKEKAENKLQELKGKFPDLDIEIVESED